MYIAPRSSDIISQVHFLPTVDIYHDDLNRLDYPLDWKN